jgi:hypothetical protein
VAPPTGFAIVQRPERSIVLHDVMGVLAGRGRAAGYNRATLGLERGDER